MSTETGMCIRVAPGAAMVRGIRFPVVAGALVVKATSVAVVDTPTGVAVVERVPVVAPAPNETPSPPSNL